MGYGGLIDSFDDGGLALDAPAQGRHRMRVVPEDVRSRPVDENGYAAAEELPCGVNGGRITRLSNAGGAIASGRSVGPGEALRPELRHVLRLGPESRPRVR